MGLGLHATCSLRQKGKWGLFSTVRKADDLRRAFERAIAGTPLAQLAIASSIKATGFNYTIYPGEEPVFVEIEGDRAIISAKTSNAGPGYHKFLVELVDRVANDLGLPWQTEDGEADETGYWEHRDFGRLRLEMLTFLSNLAKIVSPRLAEGGSGMMLGMPIGFGVKDCPDVVTSSGPVTAQQLAEASQSAHAAEPLARRHFLWWDAGFGSDFYRGLATRAMWCDVSWTPPHDESERRDLKRIVSWIDQAGPDLFPAEAVSALRKLAAATGPRVLPDTSGIGYRRLFMRYALPGSWEIYAPGSLLEGSEKNGETVALWNNDLTVRGSSISFGFSAEATPPPYDPSAEVPIKTRLEPDSSGQGHIYIAEAETLSSEKTGEICFVSVWMRDLSLKPIAEEIGASIKFLRPAQNKR